MAMSKKARAAKAAYMRDWHKKHPNRRKKYAETYWQRKAEESEQLEESATSVNKTEENIETIPKEETNNEKQ